METESLHELAELDTSNFWFRAKQWYLDRLIPGASGAILDVGCGSGGNVAGFVGRGFRVVGLDRSEVAVGYARERGIEAVQFDFEGDRDLELDFTPDYITILDFLEHVRSPERVMRALRACSSADTRAIVSVPAYQMLWSDWDETLHHVKRYRKGMLRSELESAGWRIESIGYSHLLPLVPAFLVRKIWYPFLRRVLSKPARNETFFNPGRWLNDLLYLLYLPEQLLFRLGVRLPLGLSVLAIARPAEAP